MLTITLLNSLMPNLGTNVTQFKSFISHLSNAKGDLSNLTAPPFILAPYSAVEIPTHWASHQSLFLEPAVEADSSRRVLLVLKNYLLSLKGVTASGTEHEAKKPVNPFLGEMFVGEWGAEGTKLLVEQVEHHPPVTACYIVNKERGMSSSGFIRQETSFSPPSGITVQQHGYAIIRDDKHDETHLMTMPTMRIQGLALANPHIELAGEAYIASSSGYITRIDFDGSGKLGLGKKNKVTATISRADAPEKAVWKILGQWSDKLVLKDAHDKIVEEFSVHDRQPTALSVAPVKEQSKWESRKAWSSVFEGIYMGDIQAVGQSKNTIEENQRHLRQDEKERGISWESRLFTKAKEDTEAIKLLNMIPNTEFKKFDGAKTAGFWKFKGVEQGDSIISQLRTQKET